VNAVTRSLLRPVTRVSGYALLLAAVSLALVPPVGAAGPAPDPSPSGGSARPDPYPVSRRPIAPTRTVVQTQPTLIVPTPIFRPPLRTTPAVRPKHRAPVAVSPTKPVPQLVRPEPSIFASVAAGVTPGRRISRTLALAVACLVLLSGALVAGAAREVAR
jgi:hypothetical protein